MKIVVDSSLVAFSNAMKNDANILNKYINEINAYIDDIQNYWQGSDATAFINKYKNEILPRLRAYVNSFNTFEDFSSKIYNIYETLDDEYNKKINF